MGLDDKRRVGTGGLGGPDGWAAPHIFQLFECACAMGFAAIQSAKEFYSLRVVEKALLIQSLD